MTREETKSNRLTSSVFSVPDGSIRVNSTALPAKTLMNLRDYSSTLAHSGGDALGRPCPDITDRKHILNTRLEWKNGCAYRRSPARQDESPVVDVDIGV